MDIICYLNFGLIIFIVLLFIIEYTTRKRDDSNYGTIKMKTSLTYMMEENLSLFVIVDRLIEKIVIRYFLILIYLLCWGLVFITIGKDEVKISCIFQKIIFGFEDIFLAFNAIIITIIIFIATLGPKKYYIFFSKDIVLKKYKLGRLFLEIVFTCFISIVIYFMLLSNNVKDELRLGLMGTYFGIVIFNWILSLLAIIRTWQIGFNDDKFELKILGNLNEIFKNNGKLFQIKEVDEFALNQNLSFLLNNYQILIKKRKIKKIYKCKKIIFNLTYDNKTVLEQAKNKFFCFFVIIFAIFIGYLIGSKKENCIIIFNAVINILFWVSILYCWDNDYVSKFILSFVYPDFGYLFTMDNESKYVGSCAIRKKIFDKYLLKCKNIMAFYCIICNSMTVEQNTDLIKVDIVEKLYDEALLALDEELSEDEMWKDFMIKMPIIASSYFYFLKSNRIPDSISSYIGKFNEEKVKDICSIIRAFIADISRYRTFDTNAKSVKMVYKNIKELEEAVDATGFFEEILKIANNAA
jgi:hypothetical protein